MLPATRDIWQGHPSTQAWKLDTEQPDLVPELHHAAWAGDADAIQVCDRLTLFRSSDVAYSSNICTLIVFMQVYLGQGFSVSKPDRDGRTALHFAAVGQFPRFPESPVALEYHSSSQPSCAYYT